MDDRQGQTGISSCTESIQYAVFDLHVIMSVTKKPLMLRVTNIQLFEIVDAMMSRQRMKSW